MRPRHRSAVQWRALAVEAMKGRWGWKLLEMRHGGARQRQRWLLLTAILVLGARGGAARALGAESLAIDGERGAGVWAQRAGGGGGRDWCC